MSNIYDHIKFTKEYTESFAGILDDLSMISMSTAEELFQNNDSLINHHILSTTHADNLNNTLAQTIPVAVPIMAISVASTGLLKDAALFAHSVMEFYQGTEEYVEFLNIIRSFVQMGGDAQLLYQGVIGLAHLTLAPVFLAFTIKYGIDFVSALANLDAYSTPIGDLMAEKKSAATQEIRDKGFKFAGFLLITTGLVSGPAAGFALILGYFILKGLLAAPKAIKKIKQSSCCSCLFSSSDSSRNRLNNRGNGSSRNAVDSSSSRMSPSASPAVPHKYLRSQ